MFNVWMAFLYRKAHSIQRRLRWKQSFVFPIWETKDILMQPDIGSAFDQSAGHGCNTIALCAQRLFTKELLPQVSKLTPVPRLRTLCAGSRGHVLSPPLTHGQQVSLSRR